MTHLLKKIRKFKSAFKNAYEQTCCEQKIFCISMQRNGTTSVGRFLADNGFRVAGYNGRMSVKWTEAWARGDYESIFRSQRFKDHNAYEDNPWWCPDFYRVLYHRFPDSKFILFSRDPEIWFDSMVRHKVVYSLVNTYRHSKVYQKLNLFYERIDKDPHFVPEVYDPNNHLPFESARDHYIDVYNLYNREVKEYFQKYAPERLFCADLADPEKWENLGRFLGLELASRRDVHENRSNLNE
jgi:hypothetical protein